MALYFISFATKIFFLFRILFLIHSNFNPLLLYNYLTCSFCIFVTFFNLINPFVFHAPSSANDPVHSKVERKVIQFLYFHCSILRFPPTTWTNMIHANSPHRTQHFWAPFSLAKFLSFVREKKKWFAKCCEHKFNNKIVDDRARLKKEMTRTTNEV